MKEPSIEYLRNKLFREREVVKDYPDFVRSLREKYPDINKFVEKCYLYFNKMERPQCYCGNPVKFKTFDKGYNKYCSGKCSSNSPDWRKKVQDTLLKNYGVKHIMHSPELKGRFKKTMLERYGVEHALQDPELLNKAKQTNLERHGVENPMQNEEIKEKIRQTNLERYGVEVPCLSPTIREKIKRTNQKRYGTPWGFGCKKVQEKIKQTNRERYGSEHPTQNKEIINKVQLSIRQRFLEDNKVGVIGYTEDGNWIVECPHPECKLCKEKTFVTSSDPYMNRLAHGTEVCTRIQPKWSQDSTGERELFEYVSSIYTETIERSWRGLYFDNDRPKEIDIYIPSLSLGIEYNGICFHNLDIKSKDYHFKKWKAAKELDIRLITIWDFQWDNDREGVEEFIKKVLEGDKEVRYGDRVDGMSYNDWVKTDLEDIVLEEQTYEQWTYVDCGKIKQ